MKRGMSGPIVISIILHALLIRVRAVAARELAEACTAGPRVPCAAHPDKVRIGAHQARVAFGVLAGVIGLPFFAGYVGQAA